MSHTQFPILDGIAPSWADILVSQTPTGGQLLAMGSIQSINTGTTLELGEQREGGIVIKRTTGSLSQEASMTVYLDGYLAFLRNIRAQAPLRGNQRLVGIPSFLINVQWSPPGSSEIFEYRIKGCRALGRKIDASEGNDAQLVEVPLSPLQIVDVVDGEEFAWI